MKSLPFTKMHGTGNDFVVLDCIRGPVRMTPRLAQSLCDRRFGVGADQVLVVGKSRRADLSMAIFNADGSQVEMCGNGIRCLALYARTRGHVKKDAMTVEARAGIIRPVLGINTVRVDMGEPILDAARIPTRAKGRVIEKVFPLPVSLAHSWERPGAERPAPGAPEALMRAGVRAPLTLKVTAVSMGNPHAVIFVKDVDSVPLETWGRFLENHKFFPNRANVEFVQVLSPNRAKVRVWERGSGATLACGTGACAVGVAGVLTGRLQRKMTLALPGGDLDIEWAPDNHVFLTGPAKFVYDGVFRW